MVLALQDRTCLHRKPPPRETGSEMAYDVGGAINIDTQPSDEDLVRAVEQLRC